jgi:sugar lactone lactonase YvrE
MKHLLKGFLMFGTMLYTSALYAQNHQLTKIWETDSVFKVPESVLFHSGNKMLFVSNIDGKSGEKDLKGSITRISMDGEKIEHDWAINLSAPKGMGIFNQTLFVADVDEVVGINIKSGKVSQRIPVKDAVFLNDITITKNGTIYVSDSRTGNIHLIKNGKVSPYLEKQMGVNGLLAVDNDLYLLVRGTLWKSDKNKILTKVAEGMDETTDGIEQTTNKDFIVSCWSGVVYYVKADGSKQELLDTRAEKINSADIGFDAKNNIIYVPTFFKNNVVAYQLK